MILKTKAFLFNSIGLLFVMLSLAKACEYATFIGKSVIKTNNYNVQAYNRTFWQI